MCTGTAIGGSVLCTGLTLRHSTPRRVHERKRPYTNVNLHAPKHLRDWPYTAFTFVDATQTGGFNDGKPDPIQTHNRRLQAATCPEPHPIGAFHGERVRGA